eukprot:scaffold82447_cov52-Attheya_sp.AAC.4
MYRGLCGREAEWIIFVLAHDGVIRVAALIMKVAQYVRSEYNSRNTTWSMSRLSYGVAESAVVASLSLFVRYYVQKRRQREARARRGGKRSLHIFSCKSISIRFHSAFVPRTIVTKTIGLEVK